jgi:hypothetical protein
LYLDDGIAASDNLIEAESMSQVIRRDLLDFGFLIAEEKSDWHPKPLVTWLGHIFDFVSGSIYITDDRVQSIHSGVSYILTRVLRGKRDIPVKYLSSVVGRIQSASGAVGCLTNIMTKYCHMCVESRFSWNSSVFISDCALDELRFWVNIANLNGQKLDKSVVCSVDVFSDASGSGYGGYIVGIVKRSAFGVWTGFESKESSTWLEIEAVNRLLPKFASVLGGQCVRWHVDNMNVVRILKNGSMKPHLQSIVVQIYKFIRSYDIVLIPVWVPRELNKRADALSRKAYTDCDDWQVSSGKFRYLDKLWGPFTIDRFATDRNAKCLRFNSKVWCPGTEAIDSLSVVWHSEVNWLVPPPNLALSVIKKLLNENSTGVLIVPVWKSAPYWPMLCPDNNYANFISSVHYFPKVGNILCRARGRKNVFGEDSFSFQMAAFLINSA